jgi:hypothetical protein
MSFNICRGTLGSLAMFTAIRNASSRVSRLAADRGQLPQCEMSLMARNGRADCSPSCPLLEVYLPRQPMKAEAVDDPMYGPAVRCKSLRRTGGKRSCINVSGL